MEDNIFYLKKLRELRQKRKLTQEDMSKILNLGSTTYKNYENNITEPNIETLIKLANFYNVSLDELVGREADTINLKYLDENEAYLIRKILKMNDLELAKTRAYVTGLTE
ncbi:MAG TPA: helix-turn-helix transcriptional regulator [Candidatus Onthoplasma faecigallinarum]|nr:helix-turn-helix transcriptional regulator [Candidatus Onthoplasma faecigallinarum]